MRNSHEHGRRVPNTWARTCKAATPTPLGAEGCGLELNAGAAMGLGPPGLHARSWRRSRERGSALGPPLLIICELEERQRVGLCRRRRGEERGGELVWLDCSLWRQVEEWRREERRREESLCCWAAACGSRQGRGEGRRACVAGLQLVEAGRGEERRGGGRRACVAGLQLVETARGEERRGEERRGEERLLG